jgi:hypothetical protein
VVLLVAVTASSVACADVLDIQAGVPDDDASSGAADPDGGAVDDGSAGDAFVATQQDASDGAHASLADAALDAGGGEHAGDAMTAPDVAGCLPPLQACTTGTDCCSGACSLALACL